MTRAEHLQWAKDRALEYIEQNDLDNAYASLISDLRIHKETEDHPAVLPGFVLKMNGQLSTQTEMKKFIEGFN